MSKLPALAGQVREQLRKYLHYRVCHRLPDGHHRSVCIPDAARYVYQAAGGAPSLYLIAISLLHYFLRVHTRFVLPQRTCSACSELAHCRNLERSFTGMAHQCAAKANEGLPAAQQILRSTNIPQRGQIRRLALFSYFFVPLYNRRAE
jgi:hypothetical protein